MGAASLGFASIAFLSTLLSCAPRLAPSLRSMEDSLASGDWAAASETFTALVSHSWTEAAALSILKRGRALAAASGWSAPQAQAALDAWRRRRSSRGLALLAAEALLEADRATEALDAARFLADSSAAPSLCSAVFLASVSSGARLRAGDWAYLAARLSRPEYLERAALEALAAKDRPAAAAYLSEALARGRAADPGLLYACGMYEACIRSIGAPSDPASPDALLRADALLLLDRRSEAGAAYALAVEAYRAEESKGGGRALRPLKAAVFLNAAASRRSLEEKLAILSAGEAAAEASDRPHFALARASALLEAGRAVEAKVLIYSLGGWNGGGSARATLALAAEAEGRDYDRVEALCLSACETARDDAALRRWSVRRMMELGRTAAAVKLLSLAGGEDDPWLAFGRAALSAARDGDRRPMERIASSFEAPFARAAERNLALLDRRAASMGGGS